MLGAGVAVAVIVATFVGSLLAIGLALALEFMNRRVRSPGDIVQLVDMQVIGVLPKPTRKNWFRVGRTGSMQTRLVGYHGRAV